jgi:NitT/TauT family transport system substrate-binding protein
MWHAHLIVEAFEGHLMHAVQSRRHFLASASLAATASVLGGGRALAEEGLPETTTIRLPQNSNICLAPGYIADDLLRAEGFTDIRRVPSPGGFSFPQMAGRGEIDFGLSFAGSVVFHLDAGVPVTTLAGVHSGCYELFAHEPIRAISDLKGKSVAIQTLSSSGHLYLSIMAAHVGLDPRQDINWVTPQTGSAMELFADGKVDAFLGFPPEPQELRARNIGRVILNTVMDQPWSQYLCCKLFASRDFVRNNPVATKRALRAILKAADFCAAEPERAAQGLVDAGFAPRYDYALQTLTELPYDRWREFDPEDAMRFYALRLHEVGMITSSPKQLLADGTDWTFLNELKRELKA